MVGVLLQLDWGVFSCIVCNFMRRKFNADQVFFQLVKGTLLLKINSKSSGSCLLGSKHEDNQTKRQIWLVDMKFSSQKYLNGMNGKFGGSFLAMFVTFFLWK